MQQELIAGGCATLLTTYFTTFNVLLGEGNPESVHAAAYNALQRSRQLKWCRAGGPIGFGCDLAIGPRQWRGGGGRDASSC